MRLERLDWIKAVLPLLNTAGFAVRTFRACALAILRPELPYQLQNLLPPCVPSFSDPDETSGVICWQFPRTNASMSTDDFERRLLLKQGADFVSDLERTMREGGRTHIHIRDVERWHVNALDHLAREGAPLKDLEARLGGSSAYSDDEDLALVRGRIRSVIAALELLAQPEPRPRERDLLQSYEVFISYSDKDREEAEAIHAALAARGYPAFLAAKSLKPGDDFANKIREALLASKRLWLLVSPNSAKSDWVLTEWGAAWVLGLTIVPILLRCDSSGLPDRLRQLQAIDYHKYPTLVDSIGQEGS